MKDIHNSSNLAIDRQVLPWARDMRTGQADNGNRVRLLRLSKRPHLTFELIKHRFVVGC